MARHQEMKKAVLRLVILSASLAVLLTAFAALAQSDNPFQAWIKQRQQFIEQGYAYVGNVKSYKFHKIDCRWAKRCTKNCQAPFKTREEAVKAGFIPCKVCNP